MDYHQSQPEGLVKSFNFFNNKVPSEPVRKSYISIGSHLFIDFGKVFETTYSNGKPRKKYPWTIWVGSNVQWRLSQNGKFIVGSCQDYEEMNASVQRLIGKKYKACFIISQFMDIQFEFEGGYQIDTFLDTLLREQWTLFCENNNTAGLRAETVTELQEIQKLSKQFSIQNLFKDVSLPINHISLISSSLDGTDLFLHFEEKLSLCLDWCSWRMEKNGNYCMGCGEYGLDQNLDIHQYLDELKGKKLIKSSVIHPFQDAKFEFEDGYVIKTFSCCKNPTPWRILKNNQENVYFANMLLEKT